MMRLKSSYQQSLVVAVAVCSLRAAQCAQPRCYRRALSESLAEHLIENDNRMSVADILNDRNYFPNPKDEETVEQYFSGIPQIKFSSGKSGQNLREISRSAQRTNSMQEDFESLEESLRRIGRPDMGFYEYINPIEYFAPSGWDKHHTLYQDVQKLRGIHQIMKRNLHALNRNSPIYTSAKEMDMICNKLVERLVDIFCSTEPAFASKNKLHFLNLQRLIFETIYFFQKHHLVDSDKLGSLLTSRATAEALSRHILRSYDEEAKPKEWLPLNSKSILKQWFNYTCGNMFKEFHQNQINSFTYYFHKCAFQYYHNYPENQKLKKMNNLMKFLERAVFDNASFERSEDNGSEYILPITNQGVHKLTHNFLQIYLNGNPDTELNHVFQAIEFIEDMSPLAFERYKFSGKFKLMSFTNGILEDIENVKGYLKNKFAQKIWINSLFEQPENKNKPISATEELEILSKYIRIREFEYNRQTSGINTSDEFYIYKQPRLMEHSFQSLKSMIMKLSES
ncbi:hypothetical protein PSTG_14523 [Puccinia striiformis f. sp. tritici PST-78]|uniref:Uncharacterized protein n=1 Tax=Puccinia striiformis f. sp. tritici PST-78 TaxID=1165861 RepID=A0A0L0UYG4_9BASI|nr:hypothetical protein PSTG_14523 [Puccinia striiformis f. sp. tritici PST-78]